MKLWHYYLKVICLSELGEMRYDWYASYTAEQPTNLIKNEMLEAASCFYNLRNISEAKLYLLCETTTPDEVNSDEN